LLLFGGNKNQDEDVEKADLVYTPLEHKTNVHYFLCEMQLQKLAYNVN